MKWFHKFAATVVAACGMAASGQNAHIFKPLVSLPYHMTPTMNIVLAGSTIYGSVAAYGTNSGFIYKVNTDGSGYSNVYTFSATATNGSGVATNGDGRLFLGGLVLSNNVLYGEASTGGVEGNGTVFRVNVDGTGFTNLHNFSGLAYDSTLQTYTNGDGAQPSAQLTLAGNTLYGTTSMGGPSDAGIVFRINTDGTCFSNIYGIGSVNHFSPVTLVSNVLYWTTGATLNAVNVDGTSPVVLHQFTNTSDGVFPVMGVTAGGNYLFGTTFSGGSAGNGAIFRINTDGTGYTNLHSFLGGTDGSNPATGLIIYGDTVYGETQDGAGTGTIFEIGTDGTGYSTLWLDPYSDEGSSLFLSGNTLYGALSGSTGLVFALSLGPIPLNYTWDGSNLVLTWGNPAFSLQAASSLDGVYANVPGGVSPYTNTNASETYFRLRTN